MAYSTFVGLLNTCPGIHFGEFCKTRMASSLRERSGEDTTIMSTISPCLLIVNRK